MSQHLRLRLSFISFQYSTRLLKISISAISISCKKFVQIFDRNSWKPVFNHRCQHWCSTAVLLPCTQIVMPQWTPHSLSCSLSGLSCSLPSFLCSLNITSSCWSSYARRPYSAAIGIATHAHLPDSPCSSSPPSCPDSAALCIAYPAHLPDSLWSMYSISCSLAWFSLIYV